MSGYDFNSVQELPHYNEILLDSYTKKDIIPVSLKKTSKPKISQENWKKPFKEPKFTKTTLGKRDFFKSKDGYMFFNGGEIQFRTFPAFQGEIIGRVAKHGKVSGDAGPNGPIGIIMEKVGANPIPARRDVSNLIRQDKDKFFKMFYNEYLRAGEKQIPIEEFIVNYNIDAIVLCSIYSLPDNEDRRQNILQLALENNVELHFANELCSIREHKDIKHIEKVLEYKI